MELIDLYNENKILTGERIARGEPIPVGRYKLSIHIWIMNDLNEIYIQKRTNTRKLFPNKWENPGGGAIAGQSSKETFIREFEEELGIKPDINNSKLILSFKREKDFVDMWFVKQNFDISSLNLQKKEVSEAKWVTLKELKEMLNENEFCPTFEQSLNPFLNYLNKSN